MRQTLTDLWSKTPSSSPYGTPSAASSLADLAIKAVRWGVSEMGYRWSLMAVNALAAILPARMCGHSNRYSVPGNMRAEEVVRGLAQVVNADGAFGLVSENTFFLDPTQLGDLSRNRVIDLLNATGTSIQNLGYSVDTNAGIKTRIKFWDS